MATRMPLIVSTAVHRLCNTAISRLAPLRARNFLTSTFRPPPATGAYKNQGNAPCDSSQSSYVSSPFIYQRDHHKEFHFHVTPFPCNLSRMPALLMCVQQLV